MAIQITLFIGIFICYYISSITITKDKNKLFLTLAGIWIVLLMGSRWCNSGFGDEVMYNYVYEKNIVKSFSTFWSEYKGVKDFGFYFCYWLLAQIFKSTQVPIYLTTFFCIFSFFRHFYKNSNDPLLSVILFFAFGIFAFYMAGYRQCWAMCICLFALEAAKEKKFKKFLIWYIIAFLMHRSALSFLLVYILVNINKETSGRTIALLITLLALLFSAPLLEFSDIIFEENYATNNYSSSSLGYLINIVIMLVPIGFTLFHLYRTKEIKSINQHHLIYILLIGLVLFSLRTVYWSFERISYYYTFTICSSYANIIEGLIKDNKTRDVGRLIRFVSILLLLLIYFIARVNTGVTFFWNYL